MVPLLQMLVCTIATVAGDSLQEERTGEWELKFLVDSAGLTSSGDIGPAGPSLANTLTLFLLLIPCNPEIIHSREHKHAKPHT